MKSICVLGMSALAIISVAAHADNAPSLESHWTPMLKLSTYQAFYGMPTDIRVSPYIGTLWHKIAFSQIQVSPKGNYQTEVLLLKLDCNSHSTAVVRDIKYSDKQAVISDVSTPDAELKYVDMKGKAPQGTVEAAIFKVGLVDYLDTCLKGD